VDTEMLSESELDDRLNKSNPANRAALENEGVRAALASVQRSVESRASLEPLSRSVRRSTYRHRWVLAGVATALVAVMTLAGVQALTRFQWQPPPLLLVARLSLREYRCRRGANKRRSPRNRVHPHQPRKKPAIWASRYASKIENLLTDSALVAVRTAASEAGELGSPTIGEEHILLGLLRHRESSAGRLLTDHGIQHQLVLERFRGGHSAARSGQPDFLPFGLAGKRVIDEAMAAATRHGRPVQTTDLLLAMIRNPDGVAGTLLRELGTDPAEMASRLTDTDQMPTQ
jgi:Clp amino terminal domain, pathogenicity island component